MAYASLNEKGKATGMPPYGYRRAYDDPVNTRRVRFEVREEEAAVVGRLFEECSRSETNTRILAGKLDAEGIEKPGSGSKGLGWMPDTVVDILQNVAYLGKTYSVSRARREELIKAAWPAIVSEELFEAARCVLAKNSFGGRRAVRRQYTFSRLLICSICGQPMRSKSNYSAAYYSCRDDVDPTRLCPNAGHCLREERLLPWADQLLRRLDAIAPKRLEATRRVTSPEAVRQVEGQIKRLNDVYIRFGGKSEAEYTAELRSLQALREELLAATPVKSTIRLAGLHEAWQKATPTERRRLLGLFFDGLVVKDGQIVRWRPRADRRAEVIEIMQDVVAEPVGSVPNGGKGGVLLHLSQKLEAAAG